MNPFAMWSLGLGLARLGFDSQIVVAERLSRLSRGDAAAGVEAMRMVTEKAMAMNEAGARVVSAAATGRLEHLGPELVALYGRKVRANRTRLKR